MTEVLLYSDGVAICMEDGIAFQQVQYVQETDYINPRYQQLAELSPYHKCLAIRWAVVNYTPGVDINSLLDRAKVHIEVPQEDILVSRNHYFIYKLGELCFIGYSDTALPTYVKGYDRPLVKLNPAITYALSMARKRKIPYSMSAFKQLLTRKLGTAVRKRPEQVVGSRANFVIGPLPREVYVDMEAGRMIIPILLNSCYTYEEQREKARGMQRELVELALTTPMPAMYRYYLSKCKPTKLRVSEVNTVDVWFEGNFN